MNHRLVSGGLLVPIIMTQGSHNQFISHKSSSNKKFLDKKENKPALPLIDIPIELREVEGPEFNFTFNPKLASYHKT
jgi:hypothetical protein